MIETHLPVTLTFVSVLAILLFPLTGWVGIQRGRTGILRGDGGNPELLRRSRIHGNLMENAPLFALVLGLSEQSGLSAGWLWAAIGFFCAGRLLHVALYDSKLRGVAMALTLAPGVALAGRLLWGVWG